MNTITQDLTLGEPQVAGPLAVFPILGPAGQLAYRSFATAIELGAFVKELDEGASVGDLHLENPTDLSLLVYEGEEVLGAQQNRSFDSLGARRGRRAGARCRSVASSTAAGTRGATTSTSRPRPRPPTRSSAAPSATPSTCARLRAPRPVPTRARSGARWDRGLQRHGVDSASDAMSDLYDHRRREHRPAGATWFARCPASSARSPQVAGRPVALDLVSRADVFADLLPRLAQGYALEALGAPDAEADERSASAFVDEALHAPRAPQPTPGMGHAFGIVAPGVVGGGLTARRRARPALRVPGGARPRRQDRPAGPAPEAAVGPGGAAASLRQQDRLARPARRTRVRSGGRRSAARALAPGGGPVRLSDGSRPRGGLSRDPLLRVRPRAHADLGRSALPRCRSSG